MQTITLVLNQQEQNAFLQLIDTALRSSGLAAFDLAAHFRGKLAEAVQAASGSPASDQTQA
jgi:hypothetical protein